MPYISQVYIPAFLLVIISWIPLWLTRSGSMTPEGRVTFSLTTVLTITLLSASYSATFPHTSYMKSIDTYLLACFVMSFVTLVECSVVAFLVGRPRIKGIPKIRVHVVDRHARWAIPGCCLLYNVIYAGHIYRIAAVSRMSEDKEATSMYF